MLSLPEVLGTTGLKLLLIHLAALQVLHGIHLALGSPMPAGSDARSFESTISNLDGTVPLFLLHQPGCFGHTWHHIPQDGQHGLNVP